MTNNNPEVLKPCPFCGSDNVKTFGPYGWYGDWGISHSCKSFYSGSQEMFQGFNSEAEAISAWNTRASPPPGNREAVLEEAAKALEAKAAEAKAKHNPQRNVTALLVGQVYEDAVAVICALKTTPNTTTADHGGEVASEPDDIDEFIEEWSDCGNFGWCGREGKCTRHNYDEYRQALRALRTRHDTERAGHSGEARRCPHGILHPWACHECEEADPMPANYDPLTKGAGQ